MLEQGVRRLKGYRQTCMADNLTRLNTVSDSGVASMLTNGIKTRGAGCVLMHNLVFAPADFILRWDKAHTKSAALYTGATETETTRSPRPFLTPLTSETVSYTHLKLTTILLV